MLLVQFKYIKIHQQEIPSTNRIVLEFFCMFLYTDYLSNLHKKFRIAFTYDTNVNYQIWNLCYYLFWSYADNTPKHAQTENKG